MTKRPGRSLVTPSIAIALTIVGLLSPSTMAHPGSGIAVDRHGQIYFLDTGSGLWRIDSQGRASQLSRLLYHWLAIDEGSRFANTTLPMGALGEISKVGANPTTLLSSDYPIAIGQDGNLFYPSGPRGGMRIMRMSPSGATSALATLPPTTSGPLSHVNGLSAGPLNSLYYAEDNAIRRISAQGRIGIVVTVPKLANGPSIPGNTFHPYLRGLAVDSNG